MTRTPTVLLLTALAACSPPPARAPAGPTPAPAPSARQSSLGRYYVVSTPTVLPVRVNEPFGLDIRLYRDGSLRQPAEGASILITAAIPGQPSAAMPTTPRASAIPGQPGAFRVEGVLLPTAGDWVVTVEIREHGREDRARFELRP